MRMLVKRCSSKPVTSPSRNSSMPDHIKDRFLVFMRIISLKY